MWPDCKARLSPGRMSGPCLHSLARPGLWAFATRSTNLVPGRELQVKPGLVRKSPALRHPGGERSVHSRGKHPQRTGGV